jgi:hypothetical protein
MRLEVLQHTNHPGIAVHGIGQITIKVHNQQFSFCCRSLDWVIPNAKSINDSLD